jgi:hypothetical protein
LFLLETPKKECEIRVEIENKFLFVFMALRGFYLGGRDEIAGYGGDRLIDAAPASSAPNCAFPSSAATVTIENAGFKCYLYGHSTRQGTRC